MAQLCWFQWHNPGIVSRLCVKALGGGICSISKSKMKWIKFDSSKTRSMHKYPQRAKKMITDKSYSTYKRTCPSPTPKSPWESQRIDQLHTFIDLYSMWHSTNPNPLKAFGTSSTPTNGQIPAIGWKRNSISTHFSPLGHSKNSSAVPQGSNKLKLTYTTQTAWKLQKFKTKPKVWPKWPCFYDVHH